MKMNRRDLLKLGAMAGASAVLLPKKFVFAQGSPSLTPFVDPLPLPPVLPHASTYNVHMREFFQKLHRDLPATKLWGYNGQYIGPTFETRSGSPIHVQWLNDLPAKHFLPIDHTLHGDATSQPEVRTVVHLHGAKVLGSSDGHPEAWFTNGFAKTGPEFDHRVYFYPNDQASMMLWYHDHALGNTRLNFMTGLQGLYFIRDGVEDSLPLPRGKYEIPLMFQDRFFNADGSLDYPVQGPVTPPTPPIWIPEFFGDTGLVNGKILPFLNVEPRKYRFRMIDACNARFLHLTLVNANDPSEALTFHQIGADQGLLPAPVELPDLLMGPAERFDVVIDFAGKQGKWFTLMNDAPSPFPGGGSPGVVPFFMQFRVVLPLSQPDQPLPASLAPVPLIETDEVDVTRKLLLSEVDDATTGNPIVGQLGTADNGPNPRLWSDPVTETIKAGDTELWELYNTTTDGHPIHVHLVRFQVINRQPFDLRLFASTGQIKFIGPPEAPAANERPAWKDVVKAFPGDPANGIGRVTRIIQKFDLPNVPLDSNVQEYVWHCHILEHEDNEMMRPMNVVADT
ncbi:MAG: multicopper oxidase domain-containing protein [Acidobacteriota bacterium]|nr:multicopper oxidase domain-containing protein [Acidobacteriota bacterium]